MCHCFRYWQNFFDTICFSKLILHFISLFYYSPWISRILFVELFSFDLFWALSTFNFFHFKFCILRTDLETVVLEIVPERTFIGFCVDRRITVIQTWWPLGWFSESLDQLNAAINIRFKLINNNLEADAAVESGDLKEEGWNDHRIYKLGFKKTGISAITHIRLIRFYVHVKVKSKSKPNTV